MLVTVCNIYVCPMAVSNVCTYSILTYLKNRSYNTNPLLVYHTQLLLATLSSPKII